MRRSAAIAGVLPATILSLAATAVAQEAPALSTADVLKVLAPIAAKPASFEHGSKIKSGRELKGREVSIVLPVEKTIVDRGRVAAFHGDKGLVTILSVRPYAQLSLEPTGRSPLAWARTQGLDLSTKRGRLGSYVGANVFGVEVDVTTQRNTRLSVGQPQDPYGAELGEAAPAEDFDEVIRTIPMTAEEAKRFTSGRVRVTGEVVASPDGTTIVCENAATWTPTLDSPIDRKEKTCTLLVRFRSVVLEPATGDGAITLWPDPEPRDPRKRRPAARSSPRPGS